MSWLGIVGLSLTTVLASATLSNAADVLRGPTALCKDFDGPFIPGGYYCASDPKLRAYLSEHDLAPTLYKEICHGEVENRDAGSKAPHCGQRTRGWENGAGWSYGGWTVFEGCPPAGGADPRVSGPFWCPMQYYTVQGFAGKSGNRCGYSWFGVRCFANIPN